MDQLFADIAKVFDLWPAWLSAVTAVIAAASAVAALTPTPRDDRILSRLARFVDLLALNVGHARRRPDDTARR